MNLSEYDNIKFSVYTYTHFGDQCLCLLYCSHQHLFHFIVRS